MTGTVVRVLRDTADDTAGRPGCPARREADREADQEADRERSPRLLRAVDDAVAVRAGTAGERPESERLVLHGVAGLPCPSHGYPRP
ncbi:hypothetical protein NRK68_35605 (plasmid) [Streptomyces yangpuensis]|uniref:Uncharacterized protein n=1 Tax=Streptomyces yangpuensis TaxID=1648182 RepID=A0ABY5Q8S7_9ACTN|nr:hypothetical protein [Streptomyces yangpuensis]MBZ9593603.1 hypothetical protein [Streptomyces erythrochromogenes]UUY52585.1 hypothetical protein NRK68_35605 [Streptomyces yangpuensis]